MSGSNEVRIGDRVIASDGKDVGEVKHLVVDPAKRALSAFIVDKGIFDRGRVCDIGYVENVDGDQVLLTLDAAQASNLPEWVQQEFIHFNQPANLIGGSRSFDNAAGGIWYHMGPEGRDTPSTGSSSFFQPAIVGDVSTAIVSPISESKIVVGKGTEVYSKDGYRLGKADEISFDEEGRITSFTFQEGHLFGKKRDISVSAEEVDGLTEKYIRLKKTREELGIV